MKVFPNPENPIWNQQNTTDLFGNLYATKNINLSKKGYVSLSKKLTSINGASSTPLFGFDYVGGGYKGVYSGQILNIDRINFLTTADTNTNSNLGDSTSDLVYWNDTTYYSNANSLRRLIGTTYTNILTLTTTQTTSNYRHPICTFENKVLLAVGDGNIVRTINITNTSGTALTLPAQYIVDWIRYFGNRLYIGTRNLAGQTALVFVWDGSSAEADSAYPVYSSFALCGVFLKSTLYVLNSAGQLLQFTGGGFEEAARFPFYSVFGYHWAVSTKSSLVTNNSMIVVGEEILIGVNNSITYKLFSSLGYTSTMDGLYNGVWCYNGSNGLYHKYVTTLSSAVDLGTLWGNGAINLYNLNEPMVTFGQSPTSSVSPVSNVDEFILTDSNTYAGSNNLLQIPTEGVENRGYIQTNKIINTNVSNINRKIYIKYRNVFYNTYRQINNKIIVKYKEKDKTELYSSSYSTVDNLRFGVWLNTTTFTNSLSTTDPLSNMSVGDEIEIYGSTTGVLGGGGGYTAHISSITNVGSLWTVTLDEVITYASLNTVFRYKHDNFKKLMTIDSTTAPIDQEVEIPIDVTSKWISIKVEMRGEDVEIEQMILVDDVNTPAV